MTASGVASARWLEAYRRPGGRRSLNLAVNDPAPPASQRPQDPQRHSLARGASPSVTACRATSRQGGPGMPESLKLVSFQGQAPEPESRGPGWTAGWSRQRPACRDKAQAGEPRNLRDRKDAGAGSLGHGHEDLQVHPQGRDPVLSSGSLRRWPVHKPTRTIGMTRLPPSTPPRRNPCAEGWVPPMFTLGHLPKFVSRTRRSGGAPEGGP